MKPKNYNNPNCESTSSDCVIWAGRNIDCLELCNGDSITQVVYQAAMELCTIMDQLDISNYDLKCLLPFGGQPKDFKSFINILISKVCSIEGQNNVDPGALPEGCPDCEVPLAAFFQYEDPETGDRVTVSKLDSYVKRIGSTVSTIVNQVANANEANANLSQRINVLENVQVSEFSLPELRPVGIADPATLIPMDEFLAILEQQFVELREATGDTTDIYNAITTPPSDFNSAKALGTTGGVMGTLPGWVIDPKSLSDSFINMWLAILDLRSAVTNIQLNINTACDGIEIDFSATLENKILKLFFNGIIPSNLDSCQTLGSLFKVADNSGNYFNITVDIKNNMNNASGVVIDLTSTTLNFANDLKVSSVFCFNDINTGTTCQNYLEFNVNNNFNCPVVSLTVGTNSVRYSFIHNSGSLTYVVQLLDSTNTIIQSQNYTVVEATSILGNFNSLISNSLYRVRVLMTTGSNTKTCPLNPFTTLPTACPPPNTVSALIEP